MIRQIKIGFYMFLSFIEEMRNEKRGSLILFMIPVVVSLAMGLFPAGQPGIITITILVIDKDNTQYGEGLASFLRESNFKIHTYPDKSYDARIVIPKHYNLKIGPPLEIISSTQPLCDMLYGKITEFNRRLQDITSSENIKKVVLPTSQKRGYLGEVLFPGILVLIILQMCVSIVSEKIVSDKEKGIIEMYMLTPITRTSYLLSMVLQYSMLSFVISILYTATGAGVMCREIWKVVLPIGILSLLLGSSLTGLGFMIGAFSKVREDTLLFAMPMVMAMMFLSPIFYELQHFPLVLQKISALLPTTVAVESIRELIRANLCFRLYLFNATVLLVITLVTIWIGLKPFKWYLK